MRTNV